MTPEQMCADCGGFDVEWMRTCSKHREIIFCRGCSCPLCEEEADEESYESEKTTTIS